MSSAVPKAPPSRAQQAAKASWMAPLIVVIFNYVLKSSLQRTGSRSLVIVVVSLVIYVAGLLLAIYALSQVKTAGRKGVLAPAIVGLLLNGLFLLIIGSVVLMNRGPRTQQSSLMNSVSPSCLVG
jgi:ABC-type glycerol-3-phosphate transport system permease component